MTPEETERLESLADSLVAASDALEHLTGPFHIDDRTRLRTVESGIQKALLQAASILRIKVNV